VDDLPFVRRRQPLRDLHSKLDRFTLWHDPAVQHCTQAFALKKLRDQKRQAVVLTDVKHSENIRMVQRSDRPRLLLEAMQTVGFAGERFGKNL
jgi:hypothetical protein